MIYTLTCNPSLDYIVSMNGFTLGKTNRTTKEQMLAGGKGLNVSTVLKNLGISNSALGFVAGFTGTELQRKAEADGLVCDFIRLEEGFTRINVKVKDIDGTEINGIGPVITPAAVAQLRSRLCELEPGDMLVLAGSIPGGMSPSFYRDIMEELHGKGIEFIVDATKELLLQVLPYQPFLIKPNHHELGEIFGVELKTRESVIPYAKKLRAMGARNVLVSLAGEGAVLVEETGQVYTLPVPKGKLINAVSAGDSMVAGFIAGWQKTKDPYHAFRMAVAAGSASAFSELLATKEEIEKLYHTLG